MIWVNFKTYLPGTGESAARLAQLCQQAEEETSVKIFPVVQAVDLFRLASLNFPVWAQHLDDIEFGQNTGQILPEAVLATGAMGTVLNHSENKLPLEVIGETISRCQSLGLKTLVCTDSIEEGEEIAQLKPNFLAYEPPELIGSQTSVATAKPEVIKEFVAKIKAVPVLIGAGIHSQNDIKKGLALGAIGFLVASDVVLAEDPLSELLDLAGGFESER